MTMAFVDVETGTEPHGDKCSAIVALKATTGRVITRTPSRERLLKRHNSLPPMPPPRFRESPEIKEKQVVVELPQASWAKLLGTFVSDLCHCGPLVAAPSKEETSAAIAAPKILKATPGRRLSWYSVRPPTNNEVFTVRAISNPQEGSLPHDLSFDLSDVSRNIAFESVLSAKAEEGPECSDSSDCDIFSKRPRGRSPRDDSDSESKIGRSQSVPFRLERLWGMDGNVEATREESMCKMCCVEAADVVLLPCRHGGMCYRCFRRMLFMRPVHRGGSTCPMCRRSIREAVRITEDDLKKSVALVQYGVGIDC